MTPVDTLINTAATQPDHAPRREALVFMGIQASIEPFETQRFEVLAEELERRITVADAPGWGHGGTLSAQQRADLRRGLFDSVAEPMVMAAIKQTPELSTRPATVVGYSMGASLAAAAAASDRLDVATLVLVEPVGIRRWNPLSLLRAVRHEDQFTDDYLSRNPADAWESWDRRGEDPPPHRWADLATLGFGISRGGIMRDLERAAVRGKLRELQIVRAASSQLCHRTDVESVAARATAMGVATRVHEIPGHHQVWQSLPDVAALAQMLELE